MNFGVNIMDYGAYGDGVNDDSASLEAAGMRKRRIIFPAGTYRITRSIDFTQCSLVGEGPYLSTIVSTAPDQPAIIACGNHLELSGIGIGYDSPRSDPRCACLLVVTKGRPGQVGLYRSLISNVRLFKGAFGLKLDEPKAGPKPVFFSNTVNTLAVEEWSQWAIHNNAEGTGSCWNCVYLSRYPLTDDRLCIGYVHSVANEDVWNQLNCEWGSCTDTVLDFKAGDNLVINSLHVEGVFTKSLLTLTRPNVQINGWTVDNWRTNQPGCSVVRSAGTLPHTCRVNGITFRDTYFADPTQVFLHEQLQNANGKVIFEDAKNVANGKMLLGNLSIPKGTETSCVVNP